MPETTTSAAPPAETPAIPTPASTFEIFSLPRTVAATLIGSLAMTAAVSAAHGNLGGTLRAVKANLTQGGDFDAGVHPNLAFNIDPFSGRVSVSNQSPSRTETVPVTTRLQDPPETVRVQTAGAKKQTIDIKGGMPFAPDFAAGPEVHDTRRAEKAIDSLAHQVEQLKRQGYKVEVTAQGFASSESSLAPNSGLNHHDIPNDMAAAARGQAVAAEANQRFKDLGIKARIKVVPGKEIEDAKTNTSIEKLAESKGLAVGELITLYNHDRSQLSHADLKVMDKLGDERFVRLTLVASRPAQFITKQKHHQAEEIVTFKDQEVQGEHHGGDVIIVPLLIPWPKRRKKGEAGITPVGERRKRRLHSHPRSDFDSPFPRANHITQFTKGLRKRPRPYNMDNQTHGRGGKPNPRGKNRIARAYGGSG